MPVADFLKNFFGDFGEGYLESRHPERARGGRQNAREVLQERIFQDRQKEQDFQQNQSRLNAANKASIGEHQSNIDLAKSREADLNKQRDFSQATSVGDRFAGGSWMPAPTAAPSDATVTRLRDMSGIPEAEREFVDPNETTTVHDVPNGPDPMGRPFVEAGGQMMIPRSPEELTTQEITKNKTIDEAKQSTLASHLKSYTDAFPEFAAAHKDDIARASFHSMLGGPLPEQSMEQMATDLYKRAGSIAPTDPAQKTALDLANHLMTEKHANSASGGLGALGDITPRNPTVPHGTPDESVLEKEPSSIRALVKGLTGYQLTPPTGFALAKEGSPWNRALQLATQYDDTFDASQYKVRQNLKNDFTSGKTAQNIKSLNTVIAHLDSLDKNLKAVGNGSFHAGNSLLNLIKGETVGNPAISAANNDATAVSDELSTVFKGQNTSDKSVKDWRENIHPEKITPGEADATKTSAIELLRGRLDAIKDQWERGMGKPLTDPIISPSSQAILDRLEGKISSGKVHLRLTKNGKTADRDNLDPVKDKALIDKYKAIGMEEVK